MQVVVYEPDPTGHRFAYLAHVIPALAELQCEPILLTTPAAAAAPEFAQHLGALTDGLRVDTSVTLLAKRRSLVPLWMQWMDMVRAIRRLKPDHLYVPYGDGLVQVAGLERLLGRRPWPESTEAEVLLLRGGYTYGATNFHKSLRARFSPRIIRFGRWERIYHLNPDDLAVLQKAGGDMRARCRLMPDPIEPASSATKAEARRILGVPEAGRYLGCAGLIDTRKGIDLLLRAYRLAATKLREGDRVLLAGPVAPEIRSLFERELADELRSNRVVLVDRSLSGSEINLAVTAMDVVCTPYPIHIHSASIVIRAAAAGRPVLGSAIGWMQRTVERFRLGDLCDVRNREGFAAAMVASLDAAETYAPTEAARRLGMFHSERNFIAHWTARIRERLGLPQEERIEWDWVTAALPNDAGY